MRYVEDFLYRNATEQEIAIEVNKLINASGDTLFREGGTGQNCSTLSDVGQTVYICIVTGTPLWGGETFTAVSDPAVISIFHHPLTDWYTADKSIFAYRIYLSETTNRYMDLKDIAYGNGCFVAVGDRYHSPGYSGIIAYSDDGRTWEVIKDNPFNDYGIYISAVAYGNGRFIAVGWGGKVACSTDAKTWIPVENIAEKDFTDIVYGNGLFIAGFGSGLVYSRDGETWVAVEGFDTSWISCIAHGNGRFIVGTYDGKISFSDDGKTWITITDNTFDSHEIITIACGNGRYLAFARKGYDHDPSSYKMGYSDDGETWLAFTPSKDDKEWNWIEEIIYSEGSFVAVGGDRTAYSKDGINWNNLRESYQRSYFNHPLDGIRYKAVAYGDGSFVAVSNNGITRYCQWPIVKAVAPVITEQPRWPSGRARIIYQGDTDVSYRVPILHIDCKYVSFGTYSFQWYRNDTDNTVGGVPIEGANSWDYAPDISKPGTTYYYVKLTNTIPDYFDVEAKNREASVTSNTVAITVDIPEETEIEGLDK
jgi:hypothetical protein